MADSFLAQKLALFTNPTHPTEVCHRPFVLTVAGQSWSVAAGGPWFFAVRGTSSHAPREEAYPLVVKILTADPKGIVEVETDKLKSWCGAPSKERVFGDDDLLLGVIFEKMFDRRRLASLLEHIPFPKLLVWDSTELVGTASMGLMAKGKWRAILAAVDGDVDTVLPVFDFRPEGAATFDLMSQLTED